MSYDVECLTLARHFLGDEAELGDLAERLAEAIQERIEDWLEYERDDARPEPCTPTAVHQGCICRMSSVNTATIDPPEPVINRNCPLHGDMAARDPDRARDERIDRENER